MTRRFSRARLARLVKRLAGGTPDRFLPPDPPGAVMDAPYLEALEANLPVDDAIIAIPTFRSLREDAAIEPVPLGAAGLHGFNGRIRQLGIWQMQFSWYAGQSFLPEPWRSPTMRDPKPARRARIPGRSVSTVPEWGNVYGHVLLDELPLLLWLMEDAPRLDGFDTVLCTGFALRLLARTDHSARAALERKACPVDRTTLYDVDHLTALRRTGCKTNPSPGEIAALRALRPTPPGPAAGPRRLFAERREATRAISNMDAVQTVLDRYGIVRVAPEDLADPWAAFAGADLVVGVSGSNLSDSVFMRPDAALLEIHPSDHLKPFNWNVARKIGFRYHATLAPSEIHRGTLFGPGLSPIHVPPDALDTALSTLVGKAG